jgi:hypothetical protein
MVAVSNTNLEKMDVSPPPSTRLLLEPSFEDVGSSTETPNNSCAPGANQMLDAAWKCCFRSQCPVAGVVQAGTCTTLDAIGARGRPDSERVDAPEEVKISNKLAAELSYLQWNAVDLSTWQAVVLTSEDTTAITNTHVQACLAEAYFALQARREVDRIQVRFLRRYMQYLTRCPLDPRFDARVAEALFGEHYGFFRDVCRAFGSMRK